MLSPRSLVGPFIPIATAALGAVALLALDINIAINDSRPQFSPLRADIRLLLTLTAGAGFVWLGVVVVRYYVQRNRREAAADIDRVLAKLNEMDRTEPLPRLRAVGTTVVAAASVNPAPPATRVDPEVISIARRLEGRVRGSDE